MVLQRRAFSFLIPINPTGLKVLDEAHTVLHGVDTVFVGVKDGHPPQQSDQSRWSRHKNPSRSKTSHKLRAWQMLYLSFEPCYKLPKWNIDMAKLSFSWCPLESRSPTSIQTARRLLGYESSCLECSSRFILANEPVTGPNNKCAERRSLLPTFKQAVIDSWAMSRLGIGPPPYNVHKESFFEGRKKGGNRLNFFTHKVLFVRILVETSQPMQQATLEGGKQLNNHKGLLFFCV